MFYEADSWKTPEKHIRFHERLKNLNFMFVIQSDLLIPHKTQ